MRFFLISLIFYSAAFADIITIVTGNIMGVYYPFGSAMCRVINMDSRFEGSRCIVTNSHGSSENLDLVLKNEDTFAFAQENEIARNKNNADLTGVFAVHTESLLILARSDANITSLTNDLKGKKINVGAESSGLYKITMDVLKASGVDTSLVGEILKLPQSDIEEAFCSGAIDATSVIFGHPNKIVQRLTEKCGAKIIHISSGAMDAIIAKNNAYILSKIPGGMYYGEDSDITTIGTSAMVVTSKTTSDDIVENFVKTIYENFDSIKSGSPVTSNIDKSTIVPDYKIIPIHPGAKKYFQKNGMIKLDSESA